MGKPQITNCIQVLQDYNMSHQASASGVMNLHEGCQHSCQVLGELITHHLAALVPDLRRYLHLRAGAGGGGGGQTCMASTSPP